MDPVKEFFADLRSPDPSIRFSVLSRIENLAWNDQQIDDLKKFIDLENDSGIKFHMLKILSKLENPQKSDVSASEIELLLKDPKQSEISLAIMLESVDHANAPFVIMALREANWPSFSQQLLPSVLKFLRKYGSYENAGDVEFLCRHHDPRVLSAAIEALEIIAPDRLKDLIVPLLINDNFGIRSRAVRLLHRWDPSESLRHFESMLFSSQENEKQAALFHAFFFPFSQIETLLLKFISIEKDSELIKKAGLLFMANPEKYAPLRLLEVRQTTTGSKFNLIDSILKGVLQSLSQAKIIDATPDQMIEAYEKHFKEKKLKLFIEHCELGLSSECLETRLKAANKLCDLTRYGISEAKEVLTNYLAKETNENLKEKIVEYLSSCTPSTEPFIEDNSDNLNSKERQNLFASVTKENFKKIIKFTENQFKNFTSEEQVTILRKIEQFGNKSDVSLPNKCLKSENPDVLSAAIDCLSVLDPDILYPFLPQLIKHSSEEVRSSALRVFALYDKQQALALIENLLFSIRPGKRKQAILCIGHFDFPSTRQLLLKAIRTENDSENMQLICSLLRSNADEEVFYTLYSDSKSCNAYSKTSFDTLCNQIADKLSSSDNPIPKQRLYENAIKKLEEEEIRESQRKAYKLEEIQKIRQESEKKPVFDAGLIKFTIIAYSIGAILTAFIWFGILAPASSSQLNNKKNAKLPILKKVFIIKGKISEVVKSSRKITIKNEFENKKTYTITIPESYGKLPETGENFHAQVKIISEKNNTDTKMLTAF